MEYILPSIISCGYFNCEEKFGNLKKSPERTSKCFEIELYLEDGYSTFLNGKELKVIKNYIVIAKPNNTRCSLLPFRTVYLKVTACGKIKEQLEKLPDYFPCIHTGQVTELLNEIILLSEEREKNNILIGSKVLLLIDYLVKDAGCSNSENTNIYRLMHQSKKFIEANYDKNISTTDIAQCVNLSESRFRFLFGETYGISPHQYLISVRVTNAKQMLWKNSISLSMIAEKCGFGSVQYFNYIFKKETGKTPGRYKKEFAIKYNS